MPKRFPQQLKEAIEELKDSGKESVPCDGLISYLDKVLDSPSDELTASEFEQHKAWLQAWVETNKAVHASELEMFRSVIASGQNALRSAFLLNGGAAVAVLAFLGKLADQHQDRIAQFAGSLILFVVGVLSVTMATGATYLSQWFYNNEPGWKLKTGSAVAQE